MKERLVLFIAHVIDPFLVQDPFHVPSQSQSPFPMVAPNPSHDHLSAQNQYLVVLTNLDTGLFTNTSEATVVLEEERFIHHLAGATECSLHQMMSSMYKYQNITNAHTSIVSLP